MQGKGLSLSGAVADPTAAGSARAAAAGLSQRAADEPIPLQLVPGTERSCEGQRPAGGLEEKSQRPCRERLTRHPASCTSGPSDTSAKPGLLGLTPHRAHSRAPGTKQHPAPRTGEALYHFHIILRFSSFPFLATSQPDKACTLTWTQPQNLHRWFHVSRIAGNESSDPGRDLTTCSGFMRQNFGSGGTQGWLL